MKMFVMRLALASLLLTIILQPAFGDDDGVASDKSSNSMNVLFIGNSYTARHNLANVVKKIAESADPTLTFHVTTVIYGGRTLADHWRLGTQNYVKLHELTAAEEAATISSLEEAAKDPKDRYAKGALAKHRTLLAELEDQRTTWDVVVLQSYRDDLKGAESLYMQYAPKFAELAKAQGAKVILYETTPTTQNAEPLNVAPNPKPILAKAHSIAKLANSIEANAAPMSLVALQCQTERPDLTLRFVNDAHLNQTMAYLTACTIYAAIFDKSSEGTPVDSITDIRYWNNKDRTKDRDGKPITRQFSKKDQADLQRIAWESYQRFQRLRAE